LSGGTAHAHVYGAGPHNAQLNHSLNEAQVPHVGHIKVTLQAPADCEGALGCTDSSWKHHEIYVDPDQSNLQFVVTFWHEAGHQWDFTGLGAKFHDDWKALNNWPAWAGWWDDFDEPPGEQFAESYAWCALGIYPDKQKVAYDYTPNIDQFQQTCDLIRRSDDG